MVQNIVANKVADDGFKPGWNERLHSWNEDCLKSTKWPWQESSATNESGFSAFPIMWDYAKEKAKIEIEDHIMAMNVRCILQFYQGRRIVLEHRIYLALFQQHQLCGTFRSNPRNTLLCPHIPGLDRACTSKTRV